MNENMLDIVHLIAMKLMNFNLHTVSNEYYDNTNSLYSWFAINVMAAMLEEN